MFEVHNRYLCSKPICQRLRHCGRDKSHGLLRSAAAFAIHSSYSQSITAIRIPGCRPACSYRLSCQRNSYGKGFGTADEISPMDCFAAPLLSQSITAIRIPGCRPACSYLISVVLSDAGTAARVNTVPVSAPDRDLKN